MDTRLKLLYAVAITFLLISCGGNSEEKIEEAKIIDFSSMETKIQTILADFEVEGDGIFHNATFDNKTVRFSGEINDSETAINALVLNMQKNPTSITANGEVPTVNSNGNKYKLSVLAQLIVGENSYPSTVYYNSDISALSGIAEIDFNGVSVYLQFKGKK